MPPKSSSRSGWLLTAGQPENSQANSFELWVTNGAGGRFQRDLRRRLFPPPDRVQAGQSEEGQQQQNRKLSVERIIGLGRMGVGAEALHPVSRHPMRKIADQSGQCDKKSEC